MNYIDLNKTQKRVIDAFIEVRPSLVNANSITRTEVEELFKILYDKRKDGGEKIGYPMWLVKGEKVSRGAYVFPSPMRVYTPTTQVTPKRVAVLSAEDEEFLAELREAGIEA